MTDRGVHPLVARLGRLNRTGVFFGTLVLVAAALLAPGWAGVVLLGLLAVATVGLLAVTWRAHSGSARTQRVLVVAVILAVMVLAAVNKVR